MSNATVELTEFINARSGLDALTPEQVQHVFAALDTMEFKTCSRCKVPKPLDAFAKANNKTGRYAYCRPCARSYHADWEKDNGGNRHLMDRYGITVADYDRLLAEQGGVCANKGCNAAPTPGVRFHVDHDHRCCTGRRKTCGRCIRGLLCGPCNQALGIANDNAARLRGLAAYLEDAKCPAM